jgi:hypothetical protein
MRKYLRAIITLGLVIGGVAVGCQVLLGYPGGRYHGHVGPPWPERQSVSSAAPH